MPGYFLKLLTPVLEIVWKKRVPVTSLNVWQTTIKRCYQDCFVHVALLRGVDITVRQHCEWGSVINCVCMGDIMKIFAIYAVLLTS